MIKRLPENNLMLIIMGFEVLEHVEWDGDSIES
jgi:hypothetical protein